VTIYIAVRHLNLCTGLVRLEFIQVGKHCSKTVVHNLFLVMYPLGNTLSIKYPLTVIMNTIIGNVPIITVFLR